MTQPVRKMMKFHGLLPVADRMEFQCLGETEDECVRAVHSRLTEFYAALKPAVTVEDIRDAVEITPMEPKLFELTEFGWAPVEIEL